MTGQKLARVLMGELLSNQFSTREKVISREP